MKKFKKTLGLAVATIIAIFCVLAGNLFKGFGLGGGTGSGIGINKAEETTSEQETEKENQANDVITIKIDEETIYLDDKECKDVEELKDKISKLQASGNEKKYVFEHEYAIKKIADEVYSELHNLQDTLNLNIDYNE